MSPGVVSIEQPPLRGKPSLPLSPGVAGSVMAERGVSALRLLCFCTAAASYVVQLVTVRLHGKVGDRSGSIPFAGVYWPKKDDRSGFRFLTFLLALSIAPFCGLEKKKPLWLVSCGRRSTHRRTLFAVCLWYLDLKLAEVANPSDLHSQRWIRDEGLRRPRRGSFSSTSSHRVAAACGSRWQGEVPRRCPARLPAALRTDRRTPREVTRCVRDERRVQGQASLPTPPSAAHTTDRLPRHAPVFPSLLSCV